jgi:major type 1 subunit fimbrin (pilin)
LGVIKKYDLLINLKGYVLMVAKWRTPLLLFVLALHALPALSADGTVTVNGEVLPQTCTVNGGVPSFGVTLPTLSTSALNGVGRTAGATRFSIAMTDCVGPATTVNAYFESGPTINAAGRLINQAPGGASVDGQLQNADGSVVNLAGSQGSQNTTPALIVGQSATQNYLIAYFSNAAIATAGAFSTSVIYTLVYN